MFPHHWEQVSHVAPLWYKLSSPSDKMRLESGFKIFTNYMYLQNTQDSHGPSSLWRSSYVVIPKILSNTDIHETDTASPHLNSDFYSLLLAGERREAWFQMLSGECTLQAKLRVNWGQNPIRDTFFHLLYVTCPTLSIIKFCVSYSNWCEFRGACGCSL